jgi:hypothetical protein
MLNKKSLILIAGIFLLFFVSYVSAESITISPSVITRGGNTTITISSGEYNPYIYFYKDDSYVTSILACQSASCYGEIFNYFFDVDLFSPGDYIAYIYSTSENIWLENNFEIVELKCSDGTIWEQCSTTKPKLCSLRDHLINRCSTCGCPTGQTCQTDGSCAVPVTCSDGTAYNSCSTTKPKYCSNGNLIDKCGTPQNCGCPSGQTCQTDGSCAVPVTCSDGTAYGQCSTTKPKYCDNGNLVDKCKPCFCDLGKECQADGNCSSVSLSNFDWHKISSFDYFSNIVTTYATFISTCDKVCLDFGGIAKPSCLSGITGWNGGYCRRTVLSDGRIESASISCDETNILFSRLFGSYCCCGAALCSDGTSYNSCSTTKPKYCSNGNLVDKCGAPENCDCPSGQTCQTDGSCAIPISVSPVGANAKDMSLYSGKEIFLVSDNDWKEVLPFVSVTIWTEGNEIKKYPFLIYHKEGNRFDADSIIYFMQQFFPNKVTIIGETPQDLDNLLIAQPDLGAGLFESQIQRISTGDYFSYWSQFNTLVYVQNNYELALLTSTYASLIDAPLIIQGTQLDSSNVFSGRNVICVGDVIPAGSSCSETYNLEQLQQKYRDETHTDKIIIINPDDWTVYSSYSFVPDKSSYISKSYTKTSLNAPILASAKHELIVSTHQTDYLEIDDFIKQKINYFSPNYLTILASDLVPNKIPSEDVFDFLVALDSGYYADINEDHLPDVAVGRIAGISNSDISSYLARVLFYSAFSKTNKIKFLASSFEGKLALYTKGIADVFSEAGYKVGMNLRNEECYDFEPSEWEEQDLIFYTDHGSESWSGINSNEIPKLTNSLIVSSSCLTASNYNPFSFWANSIRKGSIAYVGAVSVSGLAYNLDDFLEGVYYSDENIGNAFKNAYSSLLFQATFTLIGDPTLDIFPEKILPRRLPDLLEIIKEVLFCDNTETSCGMQPDCVNCAAIPPEDLACDLFKTKVKGKYYKCMGSAIGCIKSPFLNLVENCPYGCSDVGGAHCRTCTNTDTSCGDGTCTNCKTLPLHDLFCSIDGDVYGYDYRCGNDGTCKPNGVPIIDDYFKEDCGSTPALEYQCSGTMRQKKTHNGKGCSDGACYDSDWGSWVNNNDCGSTPATETGCAPIDQRWTKTYNERGCSNGACYGSGSNTVYTSCTNYCANGACTCDADGVGCIGSKTCCSNKCMALSCGCKTVNQGCVFTADCCSSSTLRCVNFVCNSCSAAGTQCYTPLGTPNCVNCCSGGHVHSGFLGTVTKCT